MFTPRNTLAALILALAAFPSLVACSGGGGGGSSPGGGGPAPSTPMAVTGSVRFQPFVGSKSVLFIAVKYLDAPALFTEDPEGEARLRSIAADVEQAFTDDSLGSVVLDVDVVWPPLLINRTAGSYDPATGFIHLRADVRRAARLAGLAPETYDRVTIFSEKIWSGSAGHAWMDTTWQSHTLRWVTVHEIGHSLARGHAEFWDGDPTGAGTPIRYGDLYDPMGTGRQWSRFHHSSPYTKLRAGWIDPREVLTVETSGTYDLLPIEAPDWAIAPSALRIRQDATHDYWVFFRSLESNVSDGPVILRTDSDPYQPSYLLDMKRGSTTGLESEDAALAAGDTFTDAAAGITIKNVTPSGGRTQLEVTVDEDRQRNMDQVPVIHVITPNLDTWPVAALIDFEVAVAEPDIGDLNGVGIEEVTLSVLDTHTDPPNILGVFTYSEPPFALTLDSVAGNLPDDFYVLQVKAKSEDGGVNTVSFRFTVDNYESSLR